MTHALQDLRQRMLLACKTAERDPGSVHLVAVSKTFPPSQIIPVLEARQRIFGENRIQEALEKWPPLRTRFSEVELHLIGPLQSNKAALAVGLFDVIQTVDREKIVRRLREEMVRQKKTCRFFVQVNIGEEPQKSGIAPHKLDEFLAFCHEETLLIEGLMAIPPHQTPPKPFFDHLRALQTKHHLTALSMGMSADFESAIASGATHIRVGSALFGSR